MVLGILLSQLPYVSSSARLRLARRDIGGGADISSERLDKVAKKAIESVKSDDMIQKIIGGGEGASQPLPQISIPPVSKAKEKIEILYDDYDEDVNTLNEMKDFLQQMQAS
eukprot:CAMPEP_0170184704 /NCGR_PEP_ID=MMETSP0040_2-20121228/34409_1 /TAXON_ID=641309 /ORGANISM="Lotharella oceanica, Strain CCMP622" /LENGTH=110 /DNA_ID=CAMNT_0010430859 /DNA_START=48 /DNA_END=380 /DNA_ORIENTATION=+